MTSGAALAARATPPDPIEDAGDRAAARPAANASRHPHPVPLAEGDDRRDQASPPARPAPEPVSDRYLAPALKAAAAARARSARIRADAVAVRAPRDPGPSARAMPPPPPEARDPGLAGRAMSAPLPAPPDPGPAGRAIPPPPAARYGWSVSEKALTEPPPPWAPAADAGRRFGGLSVAAAARASTIAFQPVRRPAAAAAPVEPPAATEPPAAAEPTALAALRARAPGPDPEPEPLPAPAQRPAPSPARAAGVGGQRFARTVSESRRHLAACGAQDAGSGLVPRPTLPLSDSEPTGRSWLRLWSRR